jgi:hypothetical protein
MSRRRKRREGAVLIEAIMVSSLFILMCGVLSFVHANGLARIHTFQKARADAWQKAEAGCPSGSFGVGDVVQGIANGDLPLPDAFMPGQYADGSASETVIAPSNQNIPVTSSVSIPCQAGPPTAQGNAGDWVDQLFGG